MLRAAVGLLDSFQRIKLPRGSIAERAANIFAGRAKAEAIYELDGVQAVDLDDATPADHPAADNGGVDAPCAGARTMGFSGARRWFAMMRPLPGRCAIIMRPDQSAISSVTRESDPPVPEIQRGPIPRDAIRRL